MQSGSAKFFSAPRPPLSVAAIPSNPPQPPRHSPHAADLQNLSGKSLARGRGRRRLRRLADRSRRRLHPFLNRRAGRRDRRQALLRAGRSRPRRGRGGGARRRLALRAVPRRGALPASLRAAAAVGGALGEALAARPGWAPPLPGVGMIPGLFPLARPLLHALDAETAHQLTIKALALAPHGAAPADDPRLEVAAFGRRFPNPVGLAGVVPKPQAGNAKPRVFRLPADEAVINRLGLNSDGLPEIRARLAARRRRGGIVGVNIGANKDSSDRAGDYVTCVEALAGLVDFLTVNVSSPNTPGLRDLQGEAFLDDLLGRAVEARDRAGAAASAGTALLLKIAPDLALEVLDALVATALRRGVDGLIVSNTTIARPSQLRERELARESGGLSGKPLFGLSTTMLAETYLRVGGKVPLIGVGGVDSADAAWTKIRAGASLVQLYTALVYKGPALIEEIKRGLCRRLDDAAAPLADAVGRDAARIAAGELR